MIESSLVHHRLANGEGVDSGTIAEIVSCRDVIREEVTREVCSGEESLEGWGSVARRCERLVRKSFQSVPRKLRVAGAVALLGGMLSRLMMGR
jgi:hypothetical protein